MWVCCPVITTSSTPRSFYSVGAGRDETAYSRLLFYSGGLGAIFCQGFCCSGSGTHKQADLFLILIHGEFLSARSAGALFYEPFSSSSSSGRRRKGA
jgi:hypothetical protein